MAERLATQASTGRQGEGLSDEMQEWQFWAAVWTIAAAAGVARSMRDSDYNGCCRMVSVGFYSGFVAVGVIGFWVGSAGGHVGTEPRYLGMAALLGLAGKEQDRLVRYVITSVFDRLGVQDLPHEAKHTSNDIPDDGGSVADDHDNRKHSD